MARSKLSSFSVSSFISVHKPLAATLGLGLMLLVLVVISGIFIYPFLFSAAGLGSSDMSILADKLLTTALVAQIGALIPAFIYSFARDQYSILLNLAIALIGAIVCSWISMLFQQIIIGNFGGFSGAVLNLTLSALVGSVLSVVPSILATVVCVLRRIIAGLIRG